MGVDRASDPTQVGARLPPQRGALAQAAAAFGEPRKGATTRGRQHHTGSDLGSRGQAGVSGWGGRTWQWEALSRALSARVPAAAPLAVTCWESHTALGLGVPQPSRLSAKANRKMLPTGGPGDKGSESAMGQMHSI